MAHGNGIGSTPPSPSSTHFPETVNTPADAQPSRTGSRSPTQFTDERLALPGAPQQHGSDGTPPLSRVATGPQRRASLQSLQSPALRRSEETPGMLPGDMEMQPSVQPQSSDEASIDPERISMDDIERAMTDLVNVPLPQDVNTPERLWDYIKAALTAAVGGGITAAITFGVFRSVGAAVEHTSDAGFDPQLAKQMEAVAIGAGFGGLGNTLAAMAAAPAAMALASKVLGSSTKLVPEDPEQMVPHDAPNRDAQIAAIRTAQSQYGVDSWRNIAAGILSFGGLNAARGALTANADLSVSATYGVAILTSLLAGALTPILLQTVQANSRIEIQGPNGESQRKLLFRPASSPAPDVGDAVATAVRGFMGGRVGPRAAAHVIWQIVQRDGIVGGSTIGLGLTQAVIPTLKQAFMNGDKQSAEEANRNASALMNVIGFAMVVTTYFTLLGKVAATLPQRNPAPVTNETATDEPAELDSAPR
ncbi:hypothetical protein BWP39_11300 [Paraburkholderia acidicola]|uniref:Uncharacterized protein n=2 Tax=Paraburkholderia acidicola TaxID=1912599 RepID=A0A2A4EXT0_9BURK|nr:hypothetical protein BWP39_11300 [Paraburkholderia acidicola]